MDPLGAVLNIAHILKRAYALYDACKSAPEEFKTASRHVKSMTLAIEVVDADLIKNPRSILRQGTAIARTKLSKLTVLVRACSAELLKLEQLLAEYRRHKVGWATGGRAKVLEVQADLMVTTTALNTFLSSQGLDALGRMESMMGSMLRRLEQLGYPSSSVAQLKRRRKLAGTVIASRFIYRLKRSLSIKRKATTKKNLPVKRPDPRVKPVVNPKTRPDIKRRKTLVEDYITSSLKGGEYGAAAKVEPTEYFECWRVGKASTPFSPGVYAATQQRRGQAELKEMAMTFQQASQRVVTQRDDSVKYLLRSKKRSQYRWEFVAGRVERQAVSGLVINRRTMVIVKRSRNI